VFGVIVGNLFFQPFKNQSALAANTSPQLASIDLGTIIDAQMTAQTELTDDWHEKYGKAHSRRSPK